MMRRVQAGLCALLLAASAKASEPDFAFALIGDTPYSRFERTWFADYLDKVAGDAVEFIIHAGDIKSGGDPCNDALYADRLELFDASAVPFVLVPGDNDWSDCRRLTSGRFDPLERLDALRRVFFPAGQSLGRQRMAVGSQADGPGGSPYRENLRWQRGVVTFVTLNVVGPDNLRGRSVQAPPEFVARDAANLRWLAAAFAAARAAGSRALVVVIQADPQIDAFNDGAAEPGYETFLTRLRDETLGFPGEVLLVHGDGHIHTIDKPLRDARGRRIGNFTRIETYGSPFMGWVRVSVRAERKPVLRFQSRTYSPTPPTQRIPP